MTEIICTIITGLFAAFVSYMEYHNRQFLSRSEKLAEERQKEGLLTLKMMDANSDLTIGVAMALKRGHANGEIEEGLKKVKEAKDEYMSFHDEIVMKHLNN